VEDERIEAFEKEVAQLRALLADIIRLPNSVQQKPSSTAYSAPDVRAIQSPPVQLQYVLVPVFCLLTGYSEKAVRRKIADGVWIQGLHYRKAPDGRITMDLQAYCRWVES
jgi:hypothetical protein